MGQRNPGVHLGLGRTRCAREKWPSSSTGLSLCASARGPSAASAAWHRRSVAWAVVAEESAAWAVVGVARVGARRGKAKAEMCVCVCAEEGREREERRWYAQGPLRSLWSHGAQHQPSPPGRGYERVGRVRPPLRRGVGGPGSPRTACLFALPHRRRRACSSAARKSATSHSSQLVASESPGPRLPTVTGIRRGAEGRTRRMLRTEGLCNACRVGRRAAVGAGASVRVRIRDLPTASDCRTAGHTARARARIAHHRDQTRACVGPHGVRGPCGGAGGDRARREAAAPG